jgi:Ctr copper transporter family
MSTTPGTTVHNHDAHTQLTTMAMAGGDSASSDSSGHAGHSGSTDASAGTASADHLFMRPYLFSDKTGYFVLFKQAMVANTGGFVGALFATFLFAVFASVGYEIGKRFERRAHVTKPGKSDGGAPFSSVAIGGLAHGLRLLLHYVAMLLVMTMNIWIIIAVVLGHMVGFILVTVFGRKGPLAAMAYHQDDTGDCGC